jgi:hypothetical protein
MKKSIKPVDYGLILLVLLAVTPFLSSYRWFHLLVFGLLLVQLILRNDFKSLFNYKFFWLFIIYTLVAIIQGIIWDFAFISFLTSFSFTFLISYFIMKLYGVRFFYVLEKMIFILTIISLLIWISHEFFHPLRDFYINIIEFVHPYSSDSILEGNMKRSMIIYTFSYEYTLMDSGFYRNSGFTHEPGAFAVFLNFSIFLNYLKTKVFYSKRNLIYILALITTFSTAGYLSFAILGLLNISQSKNGYISFFYLIPFLIIFIFMYNSLDFLGRKIDSQYAEESSLGLNEVTSGRIYGARKSLYVLSKYPLHGRGLLSVSMPANRDDPEYADYGWLSEVSRYGLIIGSLGLFFFLVGFLGFINLYGANRIFFVLSIISLFISFSSQVFITNPIFFIFFFFGLYSNQLKHSAHKNFLE